MGRLGLQVGVIFGPFGGQVRPSCVQNASWKLINIKNVNFHETLRLPIPQRFLEPQDGAQNGPRRPQEALEDDFLALGNGLKICVVLGVDFGRFWAPKWHPKTQVDSLFGGLEVDLFWHVVFMLFWTASKTTQEAPKRPQEPSKRPQNPPKSAPRGSKRPQEHPRRPQRCAKIALEGAKTHEHHLISGFDLFVRFL